MKLVGDLLFGGSGQLKTARLENLATDPVAPLTGQVWYNTADLAVKFYDGTAVMQLAIGDSLSDYLLLAGGTMTGDLTLKGDPTTDNMAANKNYVDDGLALKQATITGAATTVVASDLTASMAMVSNASGKVAVHGTVTATEIGYLASVTSAIQTQLNGKEPTLGFTAVNKAGDSMSSNATLTFSGTGTVTGLAAPSASTDAVRKLDLENALAGLDFQADVLAVQIDATLDPTATPAAGARYVLTDVGALHANFGTIASVANGDIVEYVGSAFVISYDVSVKGPGALAWNRALTTWYYYNGTSWSAFGGLSGVTVGAGLGSLGNELWVNFGAGIIQTPTDEVGVDTYANGGLWLTENGTEASALAPAKLSIKLDGATLALSSSGIKVPAAGITATELAAGTIANGLQGAAGTAISVKPKTSGGIVVDADGVSVDTTWGDARYATLSGATFTGDVTLKGAPTTDLMAATKKYVDDLGTVVSTLSTRVNNCFVVVDSSTPAISHVINHAMGTKYVNVTVVDSTDNVIIPDSIVFTDTNNVTVGFTTSIACKVVVAGKKVAA